MNFPLRFIMALFLSTTSSLAIACPDLGDDLSFPGTSFHPQIKIHVDRRLTIDGKRVSHVIDIDGDKVWYDGAWKMSAEGQTNEIRGNVSLRETEDGPILGILVVKGGNLLIQSVNSDGKYDPNKVAVRLSLKAQVNHGSMGPGAGNYGPSGVMTLEIDAENKGKKIGQYSSSLDPNGPVPKALSAETESNTLVISDNKSHVSNGCGQRSETKISNGNAVTLPTPGL